MKRKDNVFVDTSMSRIESNRFDMSHDKKFTFNMGELIPVTCIPTLPGDRFHISFTNLLRFFPLIAPVMHRVRVKTEYFFVPNRILYDGWEDFITGVQDPVQPHPYITISDVFGKGNIGDYLGIPPGDYSDNPLNINCLPVAAYYKIYDDWYRDQNMIFEKFATVSPGSNTSTWLERLEAEPLLRAWEHDYFTACLPTTQQGLNGVEIPLVNLQNIPVQYTNLPGNADAGLFRNVDGTINNTIDGVTNAAGPVPLTSSMHVSTAPVAYDPNGTLTVDVQGAASSVNDLREAFSLQAFLERSIRGGIRYFEQLIAHWNTKNPDARLQRPEFIGRDVQNMTIGEVLATAQSSDDAATAEVALGTMAGHGISVGGTDGFSYECLEHGFIIGIMSVIPDTAYQDGISKHFDIVDRLDYPWPSFAHIGEQPVKLRELQAVVNSANDPETIFGYLPQYSSYRYHPSQVAGDFRDSLAYWTLGRQFTDPNAPPTLSEEFIECRPRHDIFAVTSPEIDKVIAQVINKIWVDRKLPRYGVPGGI